MSREVFSQEQMMPGECSAEIASRVGDRGFYSGLRRCFLMDFG